MKRYAGAVLSCLLLLLSGCATTAQEWVNKNSSGKYILRGKVQRFIGLTCSTWTEVRDGFVLRVDKPGCKVELKQRGQPAARQYRLASGDAIVYSEETDFVLSSTEPK